MTLHNQQPDERRLRHLAGTLLVRGFAATVLFLWALSWYRIALVGIPLGSQEATLAVDRDGILFQYGSRMPRIKGYALLREQTPGNSRPWNEKLQDIDPVWFTPAIVCCRWEFSGPPVERFRLLGIKHSLLVFVALLLVAINTWRGKKRRAAATISS